MAENKTANKQAQKPVFTKEKGRGTVKAVLSGDTVIVLSVDKSQQGLPVERNITITNIQAPTLARKKPEKKNAEFLEDDAFAWASREYLRKKVIGKQVIYTIEHRSPQNKEFGVLQLVNSNSDEAENLASSIVAAGFAKAKRPNNAPKDGNYRPEIQELIDLEEEAKRQGKGIWAEDDEGAKRPNVESNPTIVYDQFKGQSLSGIVENVRTGSSLKIVLLPSFHEIQLFLSGVQAPEQNQSGEFEPFGREAKFFTEHHILNRDVTIILEGIDRFNCYGSVSFMGHNLGEELIKNGLAKYVDWSGSKTAFSDKLKAAEKAAREKRVRIWSVEQKVVSSPTTATKTDAKPTIKLGKEIYGKVIEVINGGTITVQDQGNNEHKINLSSVKVSKMVSPLLRKEDQKKDEKRSKDAVERAYAIEAKEFLRRRLVGQKVRCVFDYSRPPPPQTENKNNNNRNNKKQEQKPEGDRPFFSVYVDKNNVAVELVEAGLAQAQEHRGGDLRSKDYELILLAEDRAKKLKKGLHAPEDKAPVFYVNDITQLDHDKARQYLPYLKRAGRQRAVVEYEFAAARYKVWVPKESAYIMFSIAAIRSPSRNEPFFAESHAFAREHIHQRDVEIEVLNQDRVGTFLGNIWVNKKNFASVLLEEGFAETMGVKDSDHSTEYIIAEEVAKRGHKHIWKDYDEAAEIAKAKKEREERDETRKPKQEFVDVVVTEILDGSRFYVQLVGTGTEQLEELMKNLGAEISDEAYDPAVNEVVKAQFTADDAWYRAKVLAKVAEGEYDVLYVDYGNAETVPISRIRQLDESAKGLPHQAVEAQLAFIKTPSIDEEYGQEAAVFLRDIVMGKTMLANIEYRDGAKLFLSLGDRDSLVMVNAALLRAGLARVESVRGKHLQQVVDLLREEESKARQSHSNIWQYGDPGFDDVDDDKPKKGKPGKDSKKEAKPDNKK